MLLLIWIYYQVVTEQHTKHLILEACHNDRIGGCHFGRDKTAEKISRRFYWKGLNKDVERWVRQSN